MNLISYVLIFLIAAAFGYGLYRVIKRKGRCSCCDGSCPGCSCGCGGNPEDLPTQLKNADQPYIQS